MESLDMELTLTDNPTVVSGIVEKTELFSTLTVTSKNPLKIACGDGIFACCSTFSYGQRSKCADLLNSYKKYTLTIIRQVQCSFFLICTVKQGLKK